MASTPSRADVLIVGASGRVGQALSRRLPGYGLSVRSVSRSATTPQTGRVDASSEEQLVACMETVRPRTVIYAVAISDPDGCERDPSLSYSINVAGAERVSAEAARIGCRVIYYSSDFVFGAPGRYFEDAPVSPLQVYGRHKAEAEQLVLNHGDNIVIRLPLLFGSRDFIAEAVSAIAQGIPLATDDRRRFPIPLSHVVQVTGEIMMNKVQRGIYHAAGADAVTKSEWAGYIAGLLGKAVPPVAVVAKPSPAARPMDVELATRHAEMATRAGTLWEATRARVAELCSPIEPGAPGS